jgi:hypothetical protein
VHPLQQTQAGLFEHSQLYFVGMLPMLFAECAAIVQRHKGVRRARMTEYVTHVVVGPDCHDQDKASVLARHDEFGAFRVVSAAWLRACDEVRTPPCTPRANVAAVRSTCGPLANSVNSSAIEAHDSHLPAERTCRLRH